MSENNTLMETMSSDRNSTYVSSYHCVSYSPSSTFLTKVDAVIFILWLASKYTFYGKTYRNFIRDNEQWLLNLVAKCHYLLALAPYLCLEVEKGRCQLQQWLNEERQVINALFPALSPSPQPLQVGWTYLKNSLQGWWEPFHAQEKKQVSSPCGQSHTSFMSSSCPQAQIVVELLPCMRVIKVNMPLRGGCALKRILPQKLVKSLSCMESHRTQQSRGRDYARTTLTSSSLAIESYFTQHHYFYWREKRGSLNTPSSEN